MLTFRGRPFGRGGGGGGGSAGSAAVGGGRRRSVAADQYIEIGVVAVRAARRIQGARVRDTRRERRATATATATTTVTVTTTTTAPARPAGRPTLRSGRIFVAWPPNLSRANDVVRASRKGRAGPKRSRDGAFSRVPLRNGGEHDGLVRARRRSGAPDSGACPPIFFPGPGEARRSFDSIRRLVTRCRRITVRDVIVPHRYGSSRTYEWK